MRGDIILKPELAASLREWQRYRGWKIKILEELEHSGGMTTREISARIGYPCHSTSNRLVEMKDWGLVEKVERWGWRITRDGIFLININYTTTTPQQHHNITTTTPQLDKEEPAPKCFHAKTCHIKRICKDTRFTVKNMTLCQNCIWDSPRHWNIPRLQVEMKVLGNDVHGKI